VGGAIRDLRDDISTELRNKANILCGRRDVILSGNSGYRFADRVTVRDGDPPAIAGTTETEDTGMPPMSVVTMSATPLIPPQAAGVMGYCSNWRKGSS